MNRKVFIVGSFAVVTAVLALGSWQAMHALTKKYAKQAPRLDNYQSWATLLNLTPEQQKKIAQLETELEGDLGSVKTELAKNRIDLCALMMSDGKNDAVKLERTYAAIGDLERQQEKRLGAHLARLKDILAQEQREKLFKTLMKDICEHCRIEKGGHEKCLCGMCEMSKQ